MRTHPQLISTIKNQHGISAVLTAIMLVMLIGFAALAIDIGYLYSTRNELQNAADAAALAATRKLGELYQTMPYAQQVGYVCGGGDKSAIEAVAQNVAIKNKAAMKTINVPISDIRIGQWDGSSFTATLSQPDAVNVTARREDSANGPIATFFARIFNKNTMAVNATATAALTGKGESEDGEIELPVAIDEDWWGPSFGNECGDQIKFSPTTDPAACGGWTSFEITPSADITLRRILQEMMDIPTTSVGHTDLSMIGGDLSVPTFDALLTLFQYKGYDVDMSAETIASINDISRTPIPAALDAAGEPVPFILPAGSGNTQKLFEADGVTPLLYPDGNERNVHIWDTYVAVYESNGCANPNQIKKLYGYAEIRLTDIKGPPDKLLQGTLLCNGVDQNDNRGGGGDFGLKGSIPGLVQ